jgi:hypothetical protein
MDFKLSYYLCTVKAARLDGDEAIRVSACHNNSCSYYTKMTIIDSETPASLATRRKVAPKVPPQTIYKLP